jgi:hypothetical protein
LPPICLQKSLFGQILFLPNTAKTYIRAPEKEEVINENADKNFNYNRLHIQIVEYSKFFWEVLKQDRFINAGYETEFNAQDNSPLKE